MTYRWLFATLLVLAGGVALTAAELQPRTVAAFDRYVRATESQLKAESFLRVDKLPAAQRTEALALMRRGELWIEAPKTLDGGREIDVPGGMIHHWVGTAFVARCHDRSDAVGPPGLQPSRTHLRTYCGEVEAAVARRRSISLLSQVHDEEGDHRRRQQ